MALWLTSDHHFGHKNIIEYSKRPFASVEEMDEQLILNWNQEVRPNDDVYHLGDIFLCRDERALSIRKRLNGQIRLVLGNHDKTAEKMSKSFVWIKDYYRLKAPDASLPNGYQEIVLLHYAMRVWNKSHHGAFHAYGHSHGSLPEDPCSRSMDIGVDSIAKLHGGKPEDYRPISYEEFKGLMAKKTWVPIDHHAPGHEGGNDGSQDQ